MALIATTRKGRTMGYREYMAPRPKPLDAVERTLTILDWAVRCALLRRG